MRSSILTISLSLFSASFAAPTAANCTQALLQSATETYISAQRAGKPLTGTTAIDYVENDKAASIITGIQSHALKIDHTRSYYDTTTCATYTEIVVADAKTPYVIGTQLHVDVEGKISSVRSLVTTTGDWLFNATGTLYYTSRESWSVIPVSDRDSRSVIQAAADAYLNLFNNKNVVVPWGTPCNRLEGGMYTGKGMPSDSCNVGVPSGLDLTNRRYVIDETVGSVDVFLNFGGKTGLPDSHEFRVEKGKLRFVHTITVQKK
ncbi:hypothetical protein VTL71DRAFT_2122 [Oculimacula yallundae]|uniref:DUF8021 domain-containing protein n=1 Tax=Oculimacula yallundae TaxID=86028 RepID=A0ABR4C9A0_9HELO